MPKKGEYIKLKNYERKIKSLFIIYADFKSILVPENNGKQNPEESYTNKNQKHIACSYGYKLVCVDDKFSKSFKTYLGKDAAYNFINSMIEESKYCSVIIKTLLNSTKCWICENDYVDNDNKVKILQLRAKFETAMVSCLRFIPITNSSDHRRV